jgi:hypothetical protein
MVLKCFVLRSRKRFVLKSNAPNAQRHFVFDCLVRMTHGAMTFIPADFCYEEFPQMGDTVGNVVKTIFALTSMAGTNYIRLKIVRTNCYGLNFVNFFVIILFVIKN